MIVFYDEIYNKELKERFLNTLDLEQYPPRWWERIFEKSYRFESDKNKDLYAFTVPEIIEFYKFLDIGTLAPLVVYNFNLVKYGQWALNENLIFDGINHFNEFDSAQLATCLNKMKTKLSIVGYDDFIDLINHKIVNDQDKFVFFCLFEGIKGKNYEEIWKMKMSDIDEKNRVVHLCTGRDVYVPEEFIQIAHKADIQEEYIGITGNLDMATSRKLIPGITIIKEKHNSQGNIARSIYRTMTRNIEAINSLNQVITSRSIRDSGLIYYLNKRAAKLGMPVQEILYTPEKCQDIIDKYQFNIETRKRWCMQYEELLDQ